MIPKSFLLEWADVAPWPESGQIEQDLIICRALIEIYRDPLLSKNLAFRGGTALNKIYFPTPFRYSEDIDLVQVEEGPIGEILDGLREALDPWLGRARVELKENAAKLRYRFISEEDGLTRNLKIEINTREHGALRGYVHKPFRTENRWFSGEAMIRTFTLEEILATKLRALLQRDKGRDLFDLDQALRLFPQADWPVVPEDFTKYLESSGQVITRAVAEERLLAKAAQSNALADMRALVPTESLHFVDEDAARRAVLNVLTHIVSGIPGEPWALIDERMNELGLSWTETDATRTFGTSA